jgi:hypothetical protein
MSKSGWNISDSNVPDCYGHGPDEDDCPVSCPFYEDCKIDSEPIDVLEDDQWPTADISRERRF